MASFTSTHQAFAARVDVVVPSQRRRRGHLLHNHCLKIQALNIRNDEFADKSSSRSMVDSNLRVLWNRVNEVKVKDRLERCLLQAVNDRVHHHHHPQQQRRPAGWNYLPAATISDYRQQKKLKKKKNGLELTEVALRVSTTFGGTLLTDIAGVGAVTVIGVVLWRKDNESDNNGIADEKNDMRLKKIISKLDERIAGDFQSQRKLSR